MRRRARRTAAAAALVALLATGCGSDPAPNEGPIAGDTTTEPVPDVTTTSPEPDASTEAPTPDVTTGTPEPDVTIEPPLASDAQLAEFRDDYKAALNVTGNYWAKHWSKYFQGEYVAPELVETASFPELPGMYYHKHDEILCNGDPLPRQPNAFHCGGDQHYLAFDVEFMLQALELGDSFVYMIVAHEWGHAVAHHFNKDQQSVASELTADCLAGATLYGAIADGTLILEEGDVKEITNGLTDVADELPWGDVGDHGDPSTGSRRLMPARTGARDSASASSTRRSSRRRRTCRPAPF